MSGELLRIVDSIHRDKNIEKEIVFQGIEMALLSAAKKHYSEEDDITITIDRESGEIAAFHNGETISPTVLGRISAQTAKQIMIQKIREAERDAIYLDYHSRVGEIINGTIQRHEGGATIVNVGKTEAILPRSEQIPGESHRTGERLRAVITDVRKTNQRVKIILSRTHPDFVRRMFEMEIPEINERVIELKSLAREAGYRSKVAVVSIDNKVDCVGACVGVRGSRIKHIVDELGGNERIDIVRWNESLHVMIPNALQPAEIEDVMLFPMLGRAIVLVKEDQLSLAIGRRGQNVRLASKLVGLDIEIMTADELDEQIERATGWFTSIKHVDESLAEQFVEHGFLSFDDLSIMDPKELATMDGLEEGIAQEIIDLAEIEAERVAQEPPPPKTPPAEKKPAKPAVTDDTSGEVENGEPETDDAAAFPEQAATSEDDHADQAEPSDAEPPQVTEVAPASAPGETELTSDEPEVSKANTED